MSDVTRIEIAMRSGFSDSRGRAVARRIRTHLGIPVRDVRTRDVYHVEPALSPGEAERVAREFAGPVTRVGAVGRVEDPGPWDVAISVGYRPGVTDPVGKSARVAIEDLLGRSLGPGAAVYTSRVYLLAGVDLEQGRRIARELLANEIIERISVLDWDSFARGPVDLSVPRVAVTTVPEVETIDLERSDDDLVRLSRERLLALSLDELRTIRDFFRRAGDDPARRAAGLGPAPTDAELECLAQTWSEHCKHKIMNARIRYEEPGAAPETIDSLFRTYIRGTTEQLDARIRAREGASWLVSVFHDNAGVIAATDRHHLVYKVETHNSPSALDPYGGAITGIVGVNRDPFGTGLGSELLSNVWGYCFASPRTSTAIPRGLLHPRRIREGVHQGVIDGGNQSGIPYARGWEYFDPRFLGKPLVFCGTVGRMPVTVAGRPAERKRCRPGDRIVMVGGRIGKDGIHGATFSSAELTEESPVQAVQIGDPITQKMMFDFLLEARDRGLYSAITDNGAGGLSSSVGEMAQQPGGARMDLARAPLKYQGLAPWEILVSEAQERMTVAVPPDRLDEFLELARRREVEATDLGEFTDDGMFHVLHDGRTVCFLPLEFLHDGLPPMELTARWSPPGHRPMPVAPRPDPATFGQQAREFLARENLASNELIARQYDHEVKGLTIVRPFVGRAGDVPSDAAVMQIEHGRWEGYVLAEGVFPCYSDVDAWAMAEAGVDLAVRRVLAAGARFDRIAALDNYCWPDPLPGPDNPDAEHKLAQLVRASRGLARACLAYGVPLISGKDSMKNDAVIGGMRISIPPTLLVSAIALIEDVRRAVTLETRAAGDVLFVVGETRDELGGTEWARARGVDGGDVPRCTPEDWAARYRAVSGAIRDGLVRAAHAPGRGGLLPALFQMARAARLGIEADLDAVPVDGQPGWEALAFAESCGRFLLSCAPERCAELERRLDGVPHAVLGRFVEPQVLRLSLGGEPLLDAEVDGLAAGWERTLNDDAAGEDGR
ncbi:MAG: phosphoribosylformylglycinamidine synthase [Acidobacteria bacterium]|nr:MAG: phosphoribosylformylglycinamidine synthase [Acidobacteriota bacterium]